MLVTNEKIDFFWGGFFMEFEYIPKIRAQESFEFIDFPDKFYRFIDEFNIVGVNWSQPTTISASYFLRVLQDGSSVKARGYGRGNRLENDEASIQMNEFYLSLLDHCALWKMKNGNVICTAMPYGDKESITDSFYKMVDFLHYPKTVRLQFLDDEYCFRLNGNYMIIIYCDSAKEKFDIDCPDEELRRKAIYHSRMGKLRCQTITGAYVRDRYVSEYIKRRAHGICQLCDKPAPFNDCNGKPFLETHHIIWLADGGADSIENTVALCPNCHRKMHTLNQREDIEKLLNVAVMAE